MTPTKEELDEAIAFLKDGFRQDASMIKTALTILTRYRDGELVEKDKRNICQCGQNSLPYEATHSFTCCSRCGNPTN
jgi:hypothetical protein